MATLEIEQYEGGVRGLNGGVISVVGEPLADPIKVTVGASATLSAGSFNGRCRFLVITPYGADVRFKVGTSSVEVTQTNGFTCWEKERRGIGIDQGIDTNISVIEYAES